MFMVSAFFVKAVVIEKCLFLQNKIILKNK